MGRKRKAQKKKQPWPAYLLTRVRALRRRMREEGVEALLVVYPPDIRYLTGFHGDDSWALVTRGTVIIISDRRFEEELSSRHRYCRIVMREGRISEALGKVIKQIKMNQLGLQAEHVTIRQRKALVKQVGAKRLKHVEQWLSNQRSVKDEQEIKLIRKAIRIQEQAYQALLERIEPGMMEARVAALLDFEMRERGAAGPGFPTIVAAGSNASLPHAVPGGRKLKPDAPVLIDFGAVAEGYHGDLTRVIALGRMPRKVAEIYAIVREAQAAGIEAISPGAELKAVDEAARSVIRDAGYGEQFGHSLGHGLGLGVHEQPGISYRSEGELQAGHVVTVEPGIYLPGVGGVRIEDDVLVTENGYRKLSRLPSDLESASIG